MRRRPCSIVLFDEIEKAHPDVFNILLQVLEDGRLTDSQGRVVSFKNAMVVLTSNVGARAISAARGPGGLAARAAAAARFGPPGGAGADGPSLNAGIGGAAAAAEADIASHEAAAERARLERVVRDEVKAFFRPELLNRFDEQIVFSRLGRPELRRIASLMVAETAARVAERGYKLEVGPALMERIIRDGHSAEYGARPLRRALTAAVEDVLADAVLSGRLPRPTAAAGGPTAKAAGDAGDDAVVAYVDLDPVTGAPRCWAGRPAPAELLAPVVVAGHACGVDGEVLVAAGRAADVVAGFGGGGAPAPVFDGDGAGVGAVGDEEGAAEVFVLASGGFEEEDYLN